MKVKLIILLTMFSMNLLPLSVITKLNAQESNKNGIYLSSELYFGNYTGGNLNLNFIFKEKYSFQIGGAGYSRKSKSQPSGYSSGLAGVLTGGLSNVIYDKMESYQILVGKIKRLNEKGTRLNMSGGIGFTLINEPTNWQRNSRLFNLNSNYTYGREKRKTVSLIINPKFEFPFKEHFGLTISSLLQINKEKTFIGFGIGLMAGLLKK